MIIGLVKWFNSDKGFGIIGNPDEGEFFMHINAFISRPQTIAKGTTVVFKKKIDNKKNRNTAENCHVIGELEDWKLALNYLGKPDSVSIEVDFTGRGKKGNPYHRKENQSFSLMNLAVEQFFKERSDNEISNIITDYFENDLTKKHFVVYCDFIENIISKIFPSQQATTLLNGIFAHFGNNLTEEILFQVWKKKKFKFISYTGADEYEIPEKVLRNFIAEIGVSELKRIKDFSFGSEFGTDFINSKFRNISSLTSAEIKSLYSFLEFTSDEEGERIKSELNNMYAQKITNEIIEQANKLEQIKNDDDFHNYNRLGQLVSRQISDEEKNKIQKELNKIIASKCSEEYKPELWIKGIIEDASFEFTTTIFLASSTQADKRATILSKLHLNQQLELLKSYSEKTNFEKAFDSLESLVKKENSLGCDLELSEKLFDTEFWKDKKCNDLLNLFIQYVNDNSSDEEKYELFFKGRVKDVPHHLVKQHFAELDEDEYRKIFDSQPENKSFILENLQSKVSRENISSLAWVCDLGKKYLDTETFNLLDKKIFSSIEQPEYFKLWKKGKAKIFPQDYIETLLNDNYENYNQIENWIDNNVITLEDIANVLLSYLSKKVSITDRLIFCKHFNHIKYLLQADELYLGKIKQLKNDFSEIILWFLEKEEILDFELLRLKFIYFSPDDQVKIIRKLFSLKARGEFELTIEKLNELTRIDLDLYKTNLNFNPAIPLDISTTVIIQALSSFQEKQKFLVESELLSVVLNDIMEDKTSRFKLAHYFENCLGRQIAKFDWTKNGEIEKIKFGDTKFYFAITFPTGESHWVNNRYGSNELFRPNPNFEKLKDAVKQLPKSKWNPNAKHWGVSSQYETEVLTFAKVNRFFLNFEGSNYANNTHLAEFKRVEIPNGISFCEGRLANRSHELFNKKFWWCGGQACFKKCETIHKSEDWESYTLLDFIEILGLNTDETNRMGDFIPRGIYYQFIGLINRFNRLLEKIYCQDCNQILHPVDTGHFAAHTVVRFHCVNNNCSNNDEVYLNHCLNGQCNSLIDGRVSKKCSNGLFICDNCGSCCSHEMLKRRLTKLVAGGGYIHENLRRCVNEKLGHLERGEYFCYKCKNVMNETSTDIFHCSSCNVTYDTTKYKFKRPHKDLRTRNTTNTQNDEQNDDMPF